MYKKLTEAEKLRLLLAKVRGEDVTEELNHIYEPVTYSKIEISRAKNVLDRLLSKTPRETSYISIKRKDIHE